MVCGWIFEFVLMSNDTVERGQFIHSGRFYTQGLLEFQENTRDLLENLLGITRDY